jgi:hypothetical protein
MRMRVALTGVLARVGGIKGSIIENFGTRYTSYSDSAEIAAKQPS